MGLATVSRAFGPDGEAVLEALREGIAEGRGGEEAYRDMLDLLAEQPDWECGEGIGERRDVRVASLAAAFQAKCPQEGDSRSEPERARRPRMRIGLSQAVRPRETGPAEARWTAAVRAPLTGLEASGAGPTLRKRSLAIGNPGFALHLGHFAPALSEGRVGAVLGKPAYTGQGRSGIGGPLEAPRAALDGLALASRLGPWRLHAAGAWNRLAPQGNMQDTQMRDAGLITAGLARAAPDGRNGWGFRAQAMALRLESGAHPPAFLQVAGAEAAAVRGDWGWELSAAGSRAPWEGTERWGGHAEATLARRDRADGAGEGSWSLGLRQASPFWANPLAARRGIMRDTLDPMGGGWIAGGAGEGALSAEASLPLAACKGWRAEAKAGGELAWIGRRGAAPGDRDWPDCENLARGEGRAALAQSLGEWSWSGGAGLGWRGAGTGGTPLGGWGHSLEWRRNLWRVRARWARMAPDYAGSRPQPVSLAAGRRSDSQGIAAEWNLEWSASDAREPWRAQRLEARQSWPGGKGVEVEQRLRLPFRAGGFAPGLDYQLGLRAEF